MLKTIIVLPDGTELSSGVSEENAILSTVVQECVNEETELALGSVCANKLEVKIRTPSGALSLGTGDEVTVYKADENGTRHPIGIFALEKPVKASANSLSITAYDRVIKLDVDLSQWMADLDGTYTLYNLAEMVCEACGLELANESLPNGEFLVQPFSASGITGRAIMRWIGQATGRFCRATPDGKIEFAWYTPADLQIAPSGNSFYFQNGLTYEDYSIHPIEKVQVHMEEDDVGVVWPDKTGEKNTYVITGNYLLTAEATEELLPIVQTLYNQLQSVSYTPCKVIIPANLETRAGSIVNITDLNGKQITAYVMTSTMSGNRLTLECTGTYRRDSTTAVNNQSYKALYGKVLNLRTDVEGIFAENKDTAGKMAVLRFDVDGIGTRVGITENSIGGINDSITEIKQDATQFGIDIKDIQDNGVSRVETTTGYTFQDDGLNISRSDSEISNRIDHTGMYVTKSGNTVLRADHRGVEAVDVTVRNYLEIGHARFEEYDSDRTACFYV